MSERNPFAQRNDGGWCECSVCGRRFGGLTGFDAHRIRVPGPEYDARCATDEELAAIGLHRSPKGWWVRSAPPQARRQTPRTAVQAETA